MNKRKTTTTSQDHRTEKQKEVDNPFLQLQKMILVNLEKAKPVQEVHKDENGVRFRYETIQEVTKRLLNEKKT